MISLAFPKMFSSARTLTYTDHEATASNLKLLLGSDKYGLFGDPYYGCLLKRTIYEQNNQLLKDLLIDVIYTAILEFMPQIKLNRNNIKIKNTNTEIFAVINCINLIDYQTNMYEIKLSDSEND